MRIISGLYKGSVLQSPKSIRPTQDNVRKALFDILGDMEGVSFLELFAGSGAVGLEALSQGAAEVVCVEKDRQAVKIIRQNLDSLMGHKVEGRAEEGAVGAVTVVHKDAFDVIPDFFKDTRAFDIIFLDPPYYQELAKKTLQMLGGYDILSRCGYCVAQHFKKDALPERIAHLALIKQAVYGDSVLSFYAKESNLSR